MALVKRTKKLTADFIWESPDDDNRYEVIDGDLYVTPPPRWGHQSAASNLFLILANHIKLHDLGWIVFAPTGVVLDEGTGVQPDILFIAREHADLISERGVEGPPDLVIEILSPSTQRTDRTVKMAKYAAAGVPHYWLAGPTAQALEAYHLREESYESVGTFGTGATFEPELFPGLRITIDDIFPTDS